MPQYQLTNIKTKKTKWMTFKNEDELNDWLAIPRNGVYNRTPFSGAPALADPIKIGVTKPPADFRKYVLGKIKERNPLAKNIERRWDIPKEV